MTVLIDFTQVLEDIYGRPLIDPLAGGKDKPLTLGLAAAHVLMADFPDELRSGEEKYRDAALALRIEKDKSAVLDIEDIAKIKALIAKGYPGIVVYRAWNALDPAVNDRAMDTDAKSS